MVFYYLVSTYCFHYDAFHLSNSTDTALTYQGMDGGPVRVYYCVWHLNIGIKSLGVLWFVRLLS